MKLLVTILVLVSISVPEYSQTTYNWIGSVNSTFSAAGNWSPSRQVALNTDILVFSTGNTVIVTGVNQVTVGQLIIRNNTHLTMSPNTGNPKTFFIGGASGDDFVIETGSGLTILGNDPQMMILVKTGATASISGTLTFSGEINHNINGIDSASIRFKSGSILSQCCPGNIFTSAGMKNAVVFEKNSEIRIGHVLALNPFGLNTPDSKVRFDDGSTFRLMANSPLSLSLSGRTYGNLVIDNQSNIISSEIFSLPLSLGSVTVNQGSSLNIINRSSSSTSDINLNGNINTDGLFHIQDTSANLRNINLNLNGADVQIISGSGSLDFSNIRRFSVSGTVSMNRDLTISCPVFVYGRILRNGFNVNITGKYIESTLHSGLLGKGNGSEITNTVDSPAKFSLNQNYPNPFNPSTKIDYSIPSDSKVSLKVYDITGREVVTLVNGSQNAGSYSIQFNASNLSSGAYFYKLVTNTNGNEYSDTKKMILVK